MVAHNIVTVPTELYLCKWLKLQILHFVYFTIIHFFQKTLSQTIMFLE